MFSVGFTQEKVRREISKLNDFSLVHIVVLEHEALLLLGD
jgi:hypothetical protein